MKRYMTFFRLIASIIGILLIGNSTAVAQDCETNILIAYSPAAADSMGSNQAITAAIIDAAFNMNTVYIYSKVKIASKLVRTIRLTEEETFCFANDLNDFQANDYIMALRTKYHADIAVIVLGNDEYCGLPYYYNSLADDTTAYCAVNYACMINNFALSHQVAHLYGCGHSSETTGETTGALYSFGHGFNWYYNECASFSTVMGVDDDSYCNQEGEGACTIIPYFSNPNIQYSGVQLGIPNVNDNARVLNNNSATIGALQPVPATQNNLNDTVNLFNIARASAIDTLSTGTNYMILDSADVQFSCKYKIILNPGFSAIEGVRFETILRDPENQCGQ